MMATVPHVTSGLELRKFQADGFLLTLVYKVCLLSATVFLSRRKAVPSAGVACRAFPVSCCAKRITFFIKIDFRVIRIS